MDLKSRMNDKGEVYELYGYTQEITDLKRANEQIRIQQERLGLALRGANIGVWDWDIESAKVDFDERWCSMLGYKLDEVTPHISSLENLVHSDDKEKTLQHRQKPSTYKL